MYSSISCSNSSYGNVSQFLLIPKLGLCSTMLTIQNVALFFFTFKQQDWFLTLSAKRIKLCREGNTDRNGISLQLAVFMFNYSCDCMSCSERAEIDMGMLWASYRPQGASQIYILTADAVFQIALKQARQFDDC